MASQNRDRIKPGVWNGPGSAERREERRTASGARLGRISVLTRVFNARWFEAAPNVPSYHEDRAFK
jgi:hypothetical protein